MKTKTVACVFVCFSFVCTLALCTSTRAQSVLASVTGLVLDPNAAAIVDATLTAKNVDTGIETIVQTNSDGLYHFANLDPGNYEFSVSKRGFKVIVKPGVTLHVADTVSMNFNMQVGDLKETVTVESGAPTVNTMDASVSTVVDQTYVQNMPLNGRSFQDLILLTPGIVTQSPQGGGVLGQSGEFSVNGQRTEENYYTVDGVSANVGVFAQNLYASGNGSTPAATALGTTQGLVSVDDLQEFRVQSSTYSAEYGRNPGGQFVFETKSGTNQWHGTAYDYLRNNYVDANDWFNDYFDQKEPALRQNDFGGTFGGPVRIPALYNGKDKTFFFVSYEGLRLVQPRPSATFPVPDLCMRGLGPCPSYVNSAGMTVQRTPAASALLPVVNAFPLPSPNGVEDPKNGVGQAILTWSNPSSLDSTSVRFDHAVNDRLRLFFRFSDSNSSAIARGIHQDETAYGLRTYTGGVSSIFSNRLSNEFRLNYSSNEVTSSSVIARFGGSTPANLAQLAGLGPQSFPILFFLLGGKAVGIYQRENSVVQRQWSFVDTVSLSLGAHQFKFGVDYRRLAPFLVQGNPESFYLYFSENAIEVNTSGARIISAFASIYPLYKNFSAFAQDEWKLSRRLTLSSGLRWEVNPAPGVTQGLQAYTIQGTNPDSWTLAPQGTPLWHTTWFNFAPRLGAAYVVRGASGWETVVRGGGGVFFDTGQQLGSLAFQGPGFTARAFPGSGPFPGTPATQIPTILNPPVGNQGVAFGFSSHLQLPYTLQWNASIEQALGRSQALTVSYVGSHAGRLLQTNQFTSSTNPIASTFYKVQNGLTSDYDSLQMQFRRRLSRGLTALFAYGWSHCIDYGSFNLDIGYQRGDCNFDVRHNLSAAFSYDLTNVGHNGFVNAVMHHWGVDDRFTARTAFPVSLNGNTLFDQFGQQFNAGLNFVPGQPIYLYGANCASVLQGLGDLQPGQGCPGGRAINPQAFADVSSGLGNAPRNFARGFGAWQMNLAVRRDFPIKERLKLQFRAEAFNIFNHPNFGAIDSNCGSTPGVPPCANTTFGQATATLGNSLGVLSPLYQTGGPRSMQFALKLIF